MTLQELLENKNYAIYRFSKESAIPKTNLLDLCSGKTSIQRAQAITIKRIAYTIGCSMEYIMFLENPDRTYLELNITDFLKDSIKNLETSIKKIPVVEIFTMLFYKVTSMSLK